MKNLILASASKTRNQILLNAGVEFSTMASTIDEVLIKEELGEDSAEKIALKLAVLKAQNVSNLNRGAFVIGADQILECEGLLYSKPVDRANSESHLKSLQGKTHRLISAVCVVCNQRVLWEKIDCVNLTMRDLSDDFIQNYLNQAGKDILSSVGGYRLEGIGAQLFKKVEGDFFTVLGLPLFPLLEFLRNNKILNT